MRRYDCSLAPRLPYVTSSKWAAAARSSAVCEGSARPASATASSAVRPGRASSRVRSSRERTMARMRSCTAGFQCPWAACASAAERCSAALRGPSSNRGRRSRVGGAGAEAPPQGGADDEDGQDDDEQAERAAGCGLRCPAEQFVDPVPDGVQGPLHQAGVVLVVHLLGQFTPGRFPRGVARDRHRRLVAREGRGPDDRAVGAQQRPRDRPDGARRRRGYRCQNSPARLTASAPRSGAGGGGALVRDAKPRGPGRGRGPRGGCAGRCTGAR